LTKQESKLLSESATLTELFNRLFTANRGFSETSTLTDAITKNFSKFLTDNPSVADDFLRLAAYQRSFSEAPSVFEQLIWGGASALSKVLTDGITVADVFSKETVAFRIYTESVTLTEVFNRLANYLRNFTETKNVVDTFSRFAVFNRTFTDASTIAADLVSRRMGKIISQVCNISETSSKFLARLFLEALTVTDSALKSSIIVRNFIESVAVAEAATTLKGLAYGLILDQFLTPGGIVSPTDLNRMRERLPEISYEDLMKMKRDFKRLLNDWR
jgi:hypothetical protein